MSNRLLSYTILISVGIHVVILGVVGRTSAARPIEVESLKLVKVDLVKAPDEIKLKNQDEPKPEPESEPKDIQPAFVPPVKQLNTAPPPKPHPKRSAGNARGPYNAASRSTGPAGNPGGALNLGSTSERGENLGDPGGTSRMGYVSNPDGGEGVGSGTGRGRANPDPTPHAADGPGLSPAPAPAPPRYVEVTVCAVSGLRPGRYCEKKETKTFREGNAPDATCSVCKEPEHRNRLADRAEPELIKDSKVDVPESVREEGIDASVKIQYTVDADGGVSDVKVTDSSGNRELDRAVVDAARKMKYSPAVQDGVPRAVKKTRTYRIRV